MVSIGHARISAKGVQSWLFHPKIKVQHQETVENVTNFSEDDYVDFSDNVKAKVKSHEWARFRVEFTANGLISPPANVALKFLYWLTGLNRKVFEAKLFESSGDVDSQPEVRKKFLVLY